METRDKGIIHTGLILIIVAVTLYVALLTLYSNGLERTLKINDYISDECWYVSSGINVARKVLGLHIIPYVNESYAVYTIVYEESCGVDGAYSEVIEYSPLALIGKVGYEKISAFTVYVPINETKGMDKLYEAAESGNTSCVRDVFPGILPDAENVNEYLNTEHPPLVKYVLGIIAWREGFRFPAFRWPSFIMAAIGLAAITAIAVRSISIWRRAALLSVAVPLFLAYIDKSVQAMSSVAMLDIYAASLDAVAAALIAYDRGLAASVVLGLAGSAKYTGLFPLPGLIVYEWLRGRKKELVVELFLSFLVIALFWAPFALRYGVGWVFSEIVGALKWHTTSRPPGGPPTTDPLGLLLGRVAFVLYYVGDKPYLEAAAHPAITLPALVLAAFGLPGALLAACRGQPGKWVPWSTGLATMYVSAIAGYAATYIAGNHTLYSFYAVQLSMLAAAVLAAYSAQLAASDELAMKSIKLCAYSPPARRWGAIIAVTAGMAVGLKLYGLYPLRDIIPILYPVGEYVEQVSGDKVAKLILLAATWLIYSALAYRAGAPQPCNKKALLRLIIPWFLAGAVSTSSPSALFAPIAALLAIIRERKILDGLVAGILLPLPAVAIGGRSTGFATAFLAGYGIVTLLVFKTSYVLSNLALIILVAAFYITAAILVNNAWYRIALASIPYPGLLAATAPMSSETRGATASALALTTIVAALLVPGATMLAFLAPLVFIVVQGAPTRR
ncbi:hypothetical protein PYJP_00160 [Pyrofollis japonicus]|uniref:hypothetical protein n=1 Tax=Pyrofollis japonicus TaxID=3060460 RepID=UPI00295BDEB5|nr:hypothetical protein [Pyrofollis japonicus]BEP16664.1 hypothetical protein PYJP_00160 [Pyrofollis japonicus]